MPWLPAVVLATGCLLTREVAGQQDLPLRAPLAAMIPAEIAGYGSRDVEISAEEQAVAGMSDYMMRVYGSAEAGAGQRFSLYVGYYASQTRGRTIHSPKNCLPGGGWEPLTSRREIVATSDGAIPVNRYLLQHSKTKQQMLVLYWYQGRGRAAASEYAVKWHLLRDRVLLHRSDEALVRVMVPVDQGEEAAFETAARVAGIVAPAVDRSVPL